MYMRSRLTLSPCCKPAFSAGPPCTVHTMHAKVRPSDPVLPPTTLMPNPRAATKETWICEQSASDAYSESKSDKCNAVNFRKYSPLFIGTCVHIECFNACIGCIYENAWANHRSNDSKQTHTDMCLQRTYYVFRETARVIYSAALFATREREKERAQSRFATREDNSHTRNFHIGTFSLRSGNLYAAVKSHNAPGKIINIHRSPRRKCARQLRADCFA